MRDYLLSEKVPGLSIQAIPRYVDDSLSDEELDRLLDPADLIVAGTGERDVQRRLGARALALDNPAIFPALYLDGGGEVFIQTSPQSPCFTCCDDWRPTGEPVRGAEALGVEAMPVIETAIELSLGILDEGSRYAELTIPRRLDEDQRQRQHFTLLREAPRLAEPVDRLRDCPSCAVGPSPLRRDATEAWRAAERLRSAEESASLAADFETVLTPVNGAVGGVVADVVAFVAEGICMVVVAMVTGYAAIMATLLLPIAAFWVLIELMSFFVSGHFA